MDRHQLLAAVRQSCVGAQTRYRLANGELARRVYLDSAASCLAMGVAERLAGDFLCHYANTHSLTHFSARAATQAYAWAHSRVLSFVGAGTDEFTCVFTGSGSTSGFNRLARALSTQRPDRDTVLVSLMEHHSNDLPHRRTHRQIVHTGLEGTGDALGPVCLAELESNVATAGERLDYAAITAASNVTGIVNPVPEIARLVHRHGGLLLVDGSQILAHRPFRLDAMADTPDALVFSGHKIYAPGSPGAMVVRRELLQGSDPIEVGGGVVEHVYQRDYILLDALPDREEAGTPNIVGAVKLAMAMEVLDRIGMEVVAAEEERMLERLWRGLSANPRVKLYGSRDRVRHPRIAAIVFNVDGFDHGLLAAILNDYYNIAVRNECFCAHPYVRELILAELWDIDVAHGVHDAQLKARQGMVRVSLGLHNTNADIDQLLFALDDVLAHEQSYKSRYRLDDDGIHRHRSFDPAPLSLFHPEEEVERALRAAVAAGMPHLEPLVA